MKNIKIYNLLSIIMLLFIGCEAEDEFLTPDFTGEVILNKISDYDLLLNSNDLDGILRIANEPGTLMSDNISLTDSDVSRLSDTELNIYSWAESIYTIDENPSIWTEHYNAIFSYNSIINNIENASDINVRGNDFLAKKYKAEALLGRAFEHLWLVNIFAQPYSETSKSSPGIPYMINDDSSLPTPSRETIEDTYAKIEQDLTEALIDLPDSPDISTRGSKAAVYGVLARMYLYKQDYDNVIINAQKALNIKNDVLDFTTFPTLPDLAKHENIENVYVRVIAGRTAFFKPLSSDLSALFNPLDLRRNLYAFFGRFGFQHVYPMIGISVPEIMLSKAEAHARKNELTNALDILNELSQKRLFVALPLSSTNQEEVLNWVLEERRRETMVSGLRFSDMRRLQLEGRIGVVTHDLENGDLVNLEEGSNRYTLAIPKVVIDKNPEMQQNPR
ncbi:RagB/SusD family nutrient uptake outer membrane protein [uncultured Croceitalea sp.]|uniref:RagB/SusD family nutrient uptake outer membrane protein n=1 Tax=uncultured Croceitalea sp. TaxID=1798908 RepID=UPI00374EFE94